MQSTTTVADEIGARNNPHAFVDLAPIDDPYDFDRDRKVNATDQIIAPNHATPEGTGLQMIAPAAPALAFNAPLRRLGGRRSGDVDGDGAFDRDDLVAVLRAAKYLTR